jgi:hypothetical protein
MTHEPRERYEKRLVASLGETADAAMARWYPLDTEQAVREMKERGCVASTWRVQQLADSLKLRQIGGTNIWFADDIDRACEYLEEVRGGLTHEAAFARSRGLTLVQLREAEQKTLAANQGAVAHEST